LALETHLRLLLMLLRHVLPMLAIVCLLRLGRVRRAYRVLTRIRMSRIEVALRFGGRIHHG
jgi:hypothetical protein